MPPTIDKDLTNKSESVERVYGFYLGKRFLVNRRYQRKLVWTVDEKRAFVDSMRNAFPVPLILLAESSYESEQRYEVIDGMQRLNAIVSFIEGEFDLDGGYFDLETMANTKLLRDKKELAQRTPLLDRGLCIGIVGYNLPLTIYPAGKHDKVDEIFRRINAYGRHLSKQELRVAGVATGLSHLVRDLASRIRGDVSVGDKLILNAMRDISITSKALDYGINVESIFWVHHGILTRENVRQSRDEELIADLLGYVLLNPKPSSSSDVLDEIFGFSPAGSPSPKREEVETAIKKVGAEQLVKSFMATHEVLRGVIAKSGKRFNHLMFKEAGGRVPRYYQSVFLAVYDLVINDGMVLKDDKKAAKLLDGAGANIEVGDGGGRWSAADREKNANAIKGIIRPAFAKRGVNDPVLSSWVTEFENLLMQSSTEQSLYDFKQGFMNLDGSGTLDDAVFEKVFKTLAAMANHGPGSTGYVIVGVADSKQTADRLEQLHGIKATLYNKFRITGIHQEAQGAKGLDGYLQLVIQKLAASGIAKPVKDQIKRDIRLMTYFDKSLLVLEVRADKVPCAFSGAYYERHGPNVALIAQEQYPALFQRFLQPQT